MRDPISRIPCTLNPARILAEHKVSDEGGRREKWRWASLVRKEREDWKGKLLLRAVKRSDGGRAKERPMGQARMSLGREGILSSLGTLISSVRKS